MQFTHTAARKAKQKHTEFGENCSFAFSDYAKHDFLLDTELFNPDGYN